MQAPRVTIEPLRELAFDALTRIGRGYLSDEVYRVTITQSNEGATFSLKLASLQAPYSKQWRYDEPETVSQVESALRSGYSIGAFSATGLVGIALCSPHRWNRTIWIDEFHVAEENRGKGIGRMMMEQVIARARREQEWRAIGLEAQSTNVPAIRFYQKMGFTVDGLDTSYYTNHDLDPDQEVALFLKRRLE